MLNREDHTMKAKNYKSITEILKKKYMKKTCKPTCLYKWDVKEFYLFMDFEDCENRIKQKRKVK